MRLTCVLSDAKYYWWGKGWGWKPRKNTDHRNFKVQWKSKSKRPITECIQTLPSDACIEDPNNYIKEELQKEFGSKHEDNDKLFPWPHSNRPIKGLSQDPLYQSRASLLYNRNRLLLDPINQSLVFTNTIIESHQQLPESVSQLMSDFQIDEQFLDLVDRRLQWCTTSDSILRKLPLNRVFPYLDQKPPRVFGIPRSRIENNYLRTLYDLSQTFISKHFGFVDTLKISYPYCVVPFERNNHLVILDLETDFISTVKSSNSLPFFSTTPLVTIDKALTSIEPLSWTTCFHERNIYPTDFTFKMPSNSKIQTIFLTHNHLSNLENDNFVGRAIFYCYGYAVSEARLLYGNHINDKELPDPIPIQCVFINPKDYSIGFVCFQLNTTSFQSSLKNQVWFNGPHLHIEDIMKNLIAFQVNGCVDSITKKIKNSNI